MFYIRNAACKTRHFDFSPNLMSDRVDSDVLGVTA